MANAVAVVSSMQLDADLRPVITLLVAFTGQGVAGADVLPVDVLIESTMSATQTRDGMTRAVMAKATEMGYSVAATNMILPTWQRGATGLV
ncbi:MAG: hypothetical protein AVDCRST_MAG91-3690 [uncultured Sphingomonadaceae bacterium]|uniref:Uncharacterized protein n=1 Tax=uncultured Sphingomonadaceae bacterium TaxID=169976 RepID=A0A6J4U527_9SPHN|nr:MAG: hypothetical protein AVDCRST_MAG91-3690 [uncultured Sphingomonadaceae bacterium]